jgi:hypothetical protein
MEEKSLPYPRRIVHASITITAAVEEVFTNKSE